MDALKSRTDGGVYPRAPPSSITGTRLPRPSRSSFTPHRGLVQTVRRIGLVEGDSVPTACSWLDRRERIRGSPVRESLNGRRLLQLGDSWALNFYEELYGNFECGLSFQKKSERHSIIVRVETRVSTVSLARGWWLPQIRASAPPSVT